MPLYKDETRIFSKNYWKSAAENFKNVKMITVAAMFIALRVAVKSLQISISGGLFLTADCYVNSLGSMIYGPLVGLAVGAVSDTLGCLLFPKGAYFFPFIFVEMSSSFIFGLFFWKRNITIGRSIVAKFTVNMFCNVILNSIFIKWSYYVFYGIEKAQAYNLINLTRIAKNLVLFPFEALIIAIILQAMIRPLQSLNLISPNLQKQDIKVQHILAAVLLAIFSILLIAFYIFCLKDFIAANNIKIL